MIGAEALVRWEHPKWGTVPPIEFISIAEDTGLIIKLGRMDFQSGLYANTRVESKRSEKNSNFH